jgi:hypothetical protein
LIPFWCNGSIGSTALGANDDILNTGKICKKYGIFFNVDAAYKGKNHLEQELSGFVLNSGRKAKGWNMWTVF